jgi:hypothetical protein
MSIFSTKHHGYKTAHLRAAFSFWLATSIILAAVSAISSAATQRLGIAAGETIDIAAGKAQVVPSCCMDMPRHAPEPGTLIGHFLTPLNSAVVSFGGEAPVTVAKAVADGRLALVAGYSFEVIEVSNKSKLSAHIEIVRPTVVAEVNEPITDLKLTNLEKVVGGLPPKPPPPGDDSGSFGGPNGDSQRNWFLPARRQRKIWHDQILQSIIGGQFDIANLFSGDNSYGVLDVQNDGPKISIWMTGVDGGLELWTATNGQTLDHPDAIGREALNAWVALKRPGVADCLVVWQNEKDTEVSIGSAKIVISNDRFDKFVEGNEVPTEIVDLLKKSTENNLLLVCGDADNATAKVAARFRSAAGNQITFAFGSNPFRSMRNLLHMPLVKAGDGVAVIADKSTFPITDHGVLGQLTEGAPTKRLRIISNIQKPGKISESNVIVMIGHKDEDLRDAVEQLVRSKALSGKVVAMMSCYDPSDAEFFSKLLLPPNAPVAFLVYDDTINSEAVLDVLLAMDKRLVSLQGNVPLKTILDQSVDDALNERALTPQLRADIEKMRGAHLQVSLIDDMDNVRPTDA